MFNSESDKAYCNLFCLLAFMLVIVFLNGFIPLLIIAIYFYLLTSYKNNYVVIGLYVMTAIGITCGLLNILSLFKIILIIDYIYYFLSISHLKKIFISNGDNKYKILKKNNYNLIKNMDNSDEGEINLTDSELCDDNLALIGIKDEINYFRFKNYSVRKLEKFTFSYASGLYLCFHLFILLVSVVLM